MFCKRLSVLVYGKDKTIIFLCFFYLYDFPERKVVSTLLFMFSFCKIWEEIEEKKKHCEVLFPPLPCAKLPANPEISCELAKGGCATLGPILVASIAYCMRLNGIQVFSAPHYRHKQLTSNYRVFFFINYTEIDLSYSIICRNIS